MFYFDFDFGDLDTLDKKSHSGDKQRTRRTPSAFLVLVCDVCVGVGHYESDSVGRHSEELCF